LNLNGVITTRRVYLDDEEKDQFGDSNGTPVALRSTPVTFFRRLHAANIRIPHPNQKATFMNNVIDIKRAPTRSSLVFAMVIAVSQLVFIRSLWNTAWRNK
jgi:hypothetical protein